MANMAPVFAMKMVPSWDARIDGGRTWRDGKPLLGAGKTWRGLVAGCVFGSLTAFLQSFVRYANPSFPDGLSFATFGHALYGPWAPLVIGLGFGFGAIVGDAVKSFFKRRTGREGGAPWVPFDQLDFVVGGLLFAYLASLLVQLIAWDDRNWWWISFGNGNWPKLVVLLLLTPLLHFIVNIIGYKLKMKKVPW